MPRWDGSELGKGRVGKCWEMAELGKRGLAGIGLSYAELGEGLDEGKDLSWGGTGLSWARDELDKD